MSWGKLSENVIEFLKLQFMVDMDSIYQFELIELQLMDIESEETFKILLMILTTHNRNINKS